MEKRSTVDPTTLEALEFPEVLKILSGHAQTVPGRELAEGLVPLPDLLSVKDAFEEYIEAASLISEKGRFPLGGAKDTRVILGRSYPRGSFLLPEQLLDIKANLEVSLDIRKLLKPSFIDLSPRLSKRLSTLSDQTALLRELERVIDEKGLVRDGASKRLFGIRKDIRRAKERARSVVDGFLKDEKMKEFLQEELVTIRDDRYVLSVMVGKQTEINGVIHGRSGSGATYFIEPFQLVEINNALAVLKKEEKAEEIEVLKAVTGEVLAQKDLLLSDLDTLSQLDLLQAKTLYARETRATVPSVRPGGAGSAGGGGGGPGGAGGIDLKGARHPLLVHRELKGGGEVVPVDIRISADCRVVVISGANTGGKTVALKTLGLLTLMSSSAIPVPADPDSVVVFFDSLFADVGDRQDIEASLSTFSAHVKRMDEFLKRAGPGSLVLIDEIGVGTDPSEGSALALAALETLREKGALTAVTTHLNLLKAQATVNPSYMNVSVSFNENTLRPQYRLLYDVPGASLGLSIAESLGMDHALIERARSYLKEKEGAFIESVRLIEEEKEGLERLKERLEGLEARRKEALERLRKDREELVRRAEERVYKIIKKAREEIKETVERFKQERAGGAAGGGGGGGPVGAKPVREVEEIGSRFLGRLGAGAPRVYIPEEGDHVRIEDSGTKGVVLRVDHDGRRAELGVGSLKVWVESRRLTKTGEAPGRAVAPRKTSFEVELHLGDSNSINIIGMRVDEAVSAVTKFLDNAHARGVDRVEIIHGLGTGALARAVSDLLSSSGFVKDYRFAEASRGGAGVTVAELI